MVLKAESHYFFPYSQGSSPSKKIPKLLKETSEIKFLQKSSSSEKCSASDSVSEKLQTFIYQKITEDEKSSNKGLSNDKSCDKPLKIYSECLEADDLDNYEKMDENINEMDDKTKNKGSIR